MSDVDTAVLAVRLRQIASGEIPFDEYARGRLQRAADALSARPEVGERLDSERLDAIEKLGLGVSAPHREPGYVGGPRWWIHDPRPGKGPWLGDNLRGVIDAAMDAV